MTVVCGPKSFEHICTINDVVYDTFREACVTLRLTHNDKKWIDIFTKTIIFASDESLQRLLVTALVHRNLADATAV